MPPRNAEIAEVLDRMADLLGLERENLYRARAYRNAARLLSQLPRSVEQMIREGEDLTRLPGIGRELARRIAEVVETGYLNRLRELEAHTPPDLVQLTGIAGLGPVRAQTLHRELRIRTLDQLEKAAMEGRIRHVRGFGSRIEAAILESLHRNRIEGGQGRVLLAVAEQTVLPLLEYLSEVRGVKKVDPAGSYRRRVETVGDLDIVVTAARHSAVMGKLLEYQPIVRVLSTGATRSSVLFRSGLKVDLRIVPEVSHGAALNYFTGSRDHHVALSQIALNGGLKLMESGLFAGNRRLAGRTEEEIYSALGMAFIEPELRENRGEIEAALENRLPEKLNVGHLRGDLHSHTDATDGRASLEVMAGTARELGYEYLAITDHTKNVAIARGQNALQLRRQLEKIDRLNDELEGIVLLKSAEVDILEDGALDFPDEVLRELDLTVCSIHSKFKLDREKQTRRIIRAMDNPWFNILGHGTGRLIQRRPPYDLDIERIILAARERGCFLELNAQPDRLDLRDVYLKMAREAGVKVSISTDAHHPEEFGFMRYGIYQARRGWLEPRDVLNTRRLAELRVLLRR